MQQAEQRTRAPPPPAAVDMLSKRDAHLTSALSDPTSCNQEKCGISDCAISCRAANLIPLYYLGVSLAEQSADTGEMCIFSANGCFELKESVSVWAEYLYEYWAQH